MIGRKVEINFPPKRIVSIVPSQTELLFDLGLRAEVVGITKFCVHPEEWFRTKRRVGGTKQLNFDIIKQLQPDLIIANKEENEHSQIEELASHFPVWVSDIKTVSDALTVINGIGEIVDRKKEAGDLAADIHNAFSNLRLSSPPRRVAYFIWYRPWMSVGGDTFISDIIHSIGWTNVLKDRLRYPEITLEELKDYSPDLILLSSEPFPFKEKHIQEVKETLPGVEVKLVDGEMFSWYGSRMIKAVPYLRQILTE
jgi:ABC-type Fe3+-hydroxamate transport system substrate-binding protein